MKRLIPQSLLGQLMLVLAAALLVAQLIAVAMLFRANEERRTEAAVNAIAFRIVTARDTPRDGRGRDRRDARRAIRALSGEGGRLRLPIERRIEAPAIAREERLERYEEPLRDILQRQGVEAGTIAVKRVRAGDDDFLVKRLERATRLPRASWENRTVVVAAVQRTDLGNWQVVRVPEPRRDRRVISGFIFQTLVIFLVLFAALFFAVRRLTRPLAQLTERVDSFAQRPDEVVILDEQGPADMRRLIAAHNAMEARIAALLDEKDVMLGAIGHDLKTPLAALRVRIESVPDETQRKRMAQSIEELTTSLDDILNLARVGRASEPPARTDCAALAASLVSEYEDMGEPVTMAEGERIIASVRVTWLRRALRNLIGNAVRYGKSAHINVAQKDSYVEFAIEDNGPGIPEERIAGLMEPFARGEESRSRATGGTGLGLTLARAVAEQHGGTLTLANRTEGGLRAVIRLPL